MTTAALTDAHDRPQRWRRDRTRAALAEAARQGTAMASAARRRYRRPALVIGSFACGIASAWTTFGLGAGLLATFAAGLTLEFLGGDAEDDEGDK